MFICDDRHTAPTEYLPVEHHIVQGTVKRIIEEFVVVEILILGLVLLWSHHGDDSVLTAHV